MANKKQREAVSLVEDIHKILSSLAAARCNFRESSDPDLLEAAVYEIKSLQAKYAYLIGRARELGCAEPRVLR